VNIGKKPPFALISVVVAALLLTACVTLGPDHEEPEVAWLNDWQPDLYGQLGNTEQQSYSDLSFWWQTFNDPVLNGLIEVARRESPSLRIAGLRIMESRAVLGIAGSNLYPQVQQLNGSAAYIESKSRNGGPGTDSDQSFGSYDTSFNLGWELDFWGRFRRGIESADAAFFASIASQQDAQVLLSAQVAELYFAYWTTLLRTSIARENAAIQKRSFEITEKIFRSGQGSELDLQQAKTQYLATLATIPTLETDQIRLRNALGALLGRAPGNLPELAVVDGPLPDPGPLKIDAIPAQLLLRRPDVRTAAWQIAAQSAQIGIAKADYYPSISLIGSIGWSTNSLDNSPETTSIAAGPSISWSLFDYGRIRNNVRLQDARLQLAIEAFQAKVIQAAREIDDAAISVVKTGEQRQILDDSLHAAERSLELANKRFHEGYSDFQRVLDAQRVLAAQAETVALNRGVQLGAIVGLYKALGGGWSAMPAEQLLPEPVRDQMNSRTKWGDLLTAPLPSGADSPATGTETPE
jgi:NodT family efflux transporter outer membrane factor (OMF) lipoprotein